MSKVKSKSEKLDLILREIAKVQKQMKILAQQQMKLGEDVIRLTKVAAGSDIIGTAAAPKPKPPTKPRHSASVSPDKTEA